MLGLVACQTFVIVRFWADYPAGLAFERQAMANAYHSPTYGMNGRRLPTLECFSARVCDALPADARILFRGRTGALRFAYEVYPRRVFMLPQDMHELAAGWHIQPQLHDLPDDPHLAYWRTKLPTTSADRDEFVRDHAINYIVTFDENELSACRMEAVRR